MTASAGKPGATQGPGPREPLAMAQAALTALTAAAASRDAGAPYDLHAQDSERFLRVASTCAQVAIAGQLTKLAEAIQALPGTAAALGAAAGNAAAAGLRQSANRLADIQGAAAENLSRLADEAELWRVQEPPAAPPAQPRGLTHLHIVPAGDHSGGARGSDTRLMSEAQMDGMYAVLSEADAAGDAEALADAAWRLYTEAVTARGEGVRAQTELAQLTAAARATVEREAGGEPS